MYGYVQNHGNLIDKQSYNYNQIPIKLFFYC